VNELSLRAAILSVRMLLAAVIVAMPISAIAAPTYRYATSSNRIYVESGGSTTLSEIRTALPTAPLRAVEPGIWQLDANLQIEDGSALVLHGRGIGGDVDELRLRSDPSRSVQITADHGTLDIAATKIISWDSAVGEPDRQTSDGRAFIRVRSKLGPDGVSALESRMDVIDSEIAYLGYNASEAYGLAWKVNGFTGANADLFDRVQVRGNIIGSHIHHNYYGVYTFGHQDGVWRDNEVDHNIGYGIDPHDDSDDLVIENNDVHDNGNHGIIASKRCDHLVIRGNRSYRNLGNGIMLHRASDDALVEDNQSYDNGDAGIAIFASHRATIRNNSLLRNAKAGVRLSMGAADNRVIGNQIADSGKYGFYFYRGSDTPEPEDDGRPKRNVFEDNDIEGSGSAGIKMTDGDGNRFLRNRFRDNGSRLHFARSFATELDGNAIPADVVVTISGSSSVPSSMTVRSAPLLKLQLLDDHSSAQFRDRGRAIFDPDESIYTGVTANSSVLTLTRARIGSTTTVRTRDFTATPSGTVVHIDPTTWSVSQAWRAYLSQSDGSVSYRLGGLTPTTDYRVMEAGRPLGTFPADDAGRLSFSATPGTSSTLEYVVEPL
jgi:poly(beta-D-mannuronate) C5 epimerase